MRYFVILLCFISNQLLAQNKSTYTWVWGNGAYLTEFNGSSVKPNTRQLYNASTPNASSTLFTFGHSNICDSATGKLLFLCNGDRIWDTAGNIIQNGDTLVGLKMYIHDSPLPAALNTQGSLILPKSNNQYYVFTPTITDSMYTYWYANQQLGKFPYNLLQYHIVDMNANNGLGAVVQKNVPLLTNVELSKVGMMACRHANGIDWWLLKQGADTNIIYTFLVTADTVYLHHTQGFAQPKYSYFDLGGQACFSTDGTKYAFFGTNKDRPGFLADFDRCNGMLTNPKTIKVPLDSATHPYDLSIGRLDSVLLGVCFSPNDSFLYITRQYNIYQYEWQNPDSASAWVHVKYGADTSNYLYFEKYGQMQRGPDGRIYIGKRGASLKQNNTIDYPNNKGTACGFCARCWRYDAGDGGTSNPPNIPDFNLGADSSCYWPDAINSEQLASDNFEVYPNPAQNTITILFNTAPSNPQKIEIYNMQGQLIQQCNANKGISKYNISLHVPSGIYIVKINNECKRLAVE